MRYGIFESLRYGCVETHRLAGDRVAEVEAIGVEAETVARVVLSPAILLVATNGVSEVLHVYANLIFAPRLQTQFHE